MNAAATDLCIARFQDYVGLAYTDSPLEVFTITPTEASWDSGDREVICSLYNSDFTKLTGSMRGAARVQGLLTPPSDLSGNDEARQDPVERVEIAVLVGLDLDHDQILPLGWTGRHDHIGRQSVAAFVEEVVGTGVGRVLIWIPSVVDA